MSRELRNSMPKGIGLPRGMVRCCCAALLCVAACASAGENPAALLAEGKAALEDELYGLASSKLCAYLESTARPAARLEAELLLAQAYHGMGRHGEMRALLAAGRDVAAGTALADEYEYWLAVADGALGAWDLALSRLDGFDERFPDSRLRPAALRLRGNALLNMG